MARITRRSRSARPFDVIEDLAGRWVHHQAVDGEVAAQHVFARLRFEVDRAGPAAVAVLVIAAEGRDFHLRFTVADEHDAEMRAYLSGIRKQAHDTIGRRIGRDVEVLGCDAEQQVAHASADQPCLVPGGAQPRDGFMCEGFRFHYSHANMWTPNPTLGAGDPVSGAKSERTEYFQALARQLTSPANLRVT
jgi:hypothetical protein